MIGNKFTRFDHIEPSACVRIYCCYRADVFNSACSYCIRIFSSKGEVIEQNNPSPQRVLDIQTNYLMVSSLEGVIRHGTGRRAKAIKHPVAGKTGTTNKYIDAWFIGFNPELVVGVWVGFDEYRSLGEKETGSKAACPIWVEFMSEALQGQPKIHFPVPQGLTCVKIDTKTGLLATENCENVIFEVFREGTEPQEMCNCRQLKPDRFFDIDLEAQKAQIQNRQDNP